jgi:hypothetical protein
MTKPIDEERPDDTGEADLGGAGFSTNSGGDVEVGPSGSSSITAAKRSGGDVEVGPSGDPTTNSGGDVEVGPSGDPTTDSGGDVEGGPGQPV